jgi:polar amino acid transport system substrate-binding protein
MKNRVYKFLIIITVACTMMAPASAKQVIQLSTINWEPYSGQELPNGGFFTEIVTEAFAKAGYDVELIYLPWVRAMNEAKLGNVHGVMDVYWKLDRDPYLAYPEPAWVVKEEFFVLDDTSIVYTGQLSDLKGLNIGVLLGSAQAEELTEAGIKTTGITHHSQSIKMLMAGRVDAVLMPHEVFFYHYEQLEPSFIKKPVMALTPAFKSYEMFVAFSKNKPGYKQLVSDFNHGLRLIIETGVFSNIAEKHKFNVGVNANEKDY